MSLLRIADLDDGRLRALLSEAAAFDADVRSHRGHRAGCIVGTAFFEPSTRTRLSFEVAAHRLGAHVVGFGDGQATSTAKGESLEDTARVLGGYVDLLVMRHPEEGSAARAAAVAGVPVVNAGDGPGEHPTQTLVDLYTIWKHFGDVKGRSVAVVGDLRYGRTVHSLLPALARMGASASAVPCPGLDLPDRLAAGVPKTDLDSALADCDVVYMTRVQRERIPDPGLHEDAERVVHLGRSRVEAAGFTGIVLHPLPRRAELSPDLDGHPAAKYFDQARNGVPVRMAVLASLLEGP